MNATVKRIELPAHRRAFAVSDVHGCPDYFQGLLEKIQFSPEDILILLGDLVEKGPRSLDTLRSIMDLCKTHTVYVLRGNCDHLLFDDLPNEWVFHYLSSWHGNHLMTELAALLEYKITSPGDLDGLRTAIRRHFPAESAFLDALPVILETDEYLFVHGGVPREHDLERLDAWACTKNDNFLSQGHAFRRWCIVGHWPATLYRADHPCANPLVTRDRHIVSIDGGCAIKRDGQLNALHLPPRPDGAFSWTAYDALPTAVAADRQAAVPASFHIRYGDNRLELLARGPEFSTCFHPSSGKTLELLTCDLWETERGVFCEDSTDYRLAVEPGDVLSVIQKTSRGWLVKKEGATGWYLGTLRGEGSA